jgi:hypothetical protein
MFFLPGVPGEMRRMLDETVMPLLAERARDRRHVRTGVVKVFGPSEAEVNALLRGLEESGTARIAYCVNFPEIFVKIRVEGGTAAEVDRLLADSREEVRRRVGEYIYAEDDETIDGEVARLFREKGGTLFVAESCTGGLLAKRITDVPGSSCRQIPLAGSFLPAPCRTWRGERRCRRGNGAGGATVGRKRYRPGDNRDRRPCRGESGEAGRHGVRWPGRS